MVGSYFQLESFEARVKSTLGQIPDLLIVVCHPSHGRVVAGIATLQNRDASVAAGKLALQQIDCVLFAQHLFQIAQIQQTNDFASTEIDKQFPQRFAPASAPQVETSVGA